MYIYMYQRTASDASYMRYVLEKRVRVLTLLVYEALS